jgi:membrane fusion protein (multidrug efflux system)
MRFKIKTIFSLILGSLLIFLIIFLCPFKNRELINTDNHVNVYTVSVVPKNLSVTVKSIGELYANRIVNIRSESDGEIKSILFKNGEFVKKGQALYQIDDSVFKTNLKEAEVEYHLSELAYHRSQKLFKFNAISKQEIEKVSANYNEKKLDLIQKQIQLRKSCITAPFEGTMSASQVDVGQMIKTNDILAQLVDKSSLIVHYSLPENKASQVMLYQKVEINSEAYPNQAFEGKVSFVSPVIDPNTHTLLVWAQIENPNYILSPGFFVQVSHTIGKIENALIIPQKALIPTVEGNDVFIVENGKAIRKKIELGDAINLDSQVMLKSGLKFNDQLVILGQEKLANGSAVKVIHL